MVTMTREQMCQRIRCDNSKIVREEVEHHMSIDRPEWSGAPYDEVSALLDGLQFAEDNNQNHAIKAFRKTLIDLGFYRVMSEAEIASTITSSGRAPYAFRMDHQAWTTDYYHDEWINGEPGWDVPS